jgi:hypothetical protein
MPFASSRLLARLLLPQLQGRFVTITISDDEVHFGLHWDFPQAGRRARDVRQAHRNVVVLPDLYARLYANCGRLQAITGRLAGP